MSMFFADDLPENNRFVSQLHIAGFLHIEPDRREGAQHKPADPFEPNDFVGGNMTYHRSESPMEIPDSITEAWRREAQVADPFLRPTEEQHATPLTTQRPLQRHGSTLRVAGDASSLRPPRLTREAVDRHTSTSAGVPRRPPRESSFDTQGIRSNTTPHDLLTRRRPGGPTVDSFSVRVGSWMHNPATPRTPRGQTFGDRTMHLMIRPQEAHFREEGGHPLSLLPPRGGVPATHLHANSEVYTFAPKATNRSSCGAGNTMEETCVICQDDFEENAEMRRLSKCRHVFHTLCIDRWLSANDTCPICKGNV